MDESLKSHRIATAYLGSVTLTFKHGIAALGILFLDASDVTSLGYFTRLADQIQTIGARDREADSSFIATKGQTRPLTRHCFVPTDPTKQ